MDKKLKVPNHIAIIMDGNGRWAKKRGLPRTKGHVEGSKTLKRIVNYAFSHNVKVLSIFAFSTENFKRSEEEVSFLMNLFVDCFNNYFDGLNNNGIKIVFSKKENGLPLKLEKLITKITEQTKNNEKGIFNICINYGGHQEIIDMTKKVVSKIMNGEMSAYDINEQSINESLYQTLPSIDLLIRTSNEYRVSNFMLWQLAYAEMYFTETLFPDFDENELEQAIIDYNYRDRRFGTIKDNK